jgi:hypothetical protein
MPRARARFDATNKPMIVQSLEFLAWCTILVTHTLQAQGLLVRRFVEYRMKGRRVLEMKAAGYENYQNQDESLFDDI